MDEKQLQCFGTQKSLTRTKEYFIKELKISSLNLNKNENGRLLLLIFLDQLAKDIDELGHIFKV